MQPLDKRLSSNSTRRQIYAVAIKNGLTVAAMLTSLSANDLRALEEMPRQPLRNKYPRHGRGDVGPNLAFLVLLLLFGLFVAVDAGCGTRKSIPCFVHAKTHTPAHSSSGLAFDGKRTHMVATNSPERFELLVDWEGRTETVTVSAAEFVAADVGGKLSLSRNVGCLTGIHYR